MPTLKDSIANFDFKKLARMYGWTCIWDPETELARSEIAGGKLHLTLYEDNSFILGGYTQNGNTDIGRINFPNVDKDRDQLIRFIDYGAYKYMRDNFRDDTGKKISSSNLLNPSIAFYEFESSGILYNFPFNAIALKQGNDLDTYITANSVPITISIPNRKKNREHNKQLNSFFKEIKLENSISSIENTATNLKDSNFNTITTFPNVTYAGESLFSEINKYVYQLYTLHNLQYDYLIKRSVQNILNYGSAEMIRLLEYGSTLEKALKQAKYYDEYTSKYITRGRT